MLYMVSAGVQECVNSEWRIWLDYCILQPHFHAVAQDLRHAVCKQSGS